MHIYTHSYSYIFTFIHTVYDCFHALTTELNSCLATQTIWPTRSTILVSRPLQKYSSDSGLAERLRIGV